MGVSFCLRLKKNYCIETENLIWQGLGQLGVVPGTSLYFQQQYFGQFLIAHRRIRVSRLQGKFPSNGKSRVSDGELKTVRTIEQVRVRKTQPVAGFDIACKWKRHYGGLKVKDAWFILTDLDSLPFALSAYKKRMKIKEMFRDCKKGGYNLEGSGLRGERLIKMILLMAIAYSCAIFQGTEIKNKQVQKYVYRCSQARKKYRKRSTFGVGFEGEQWVDYLDRHSLEIQDLMKLTRNKRRFYQQGIRAAPLIRSIS